MKASIHSSHRDGSAGRSWPFYGWLILGIAMVAVVATSPGQSYLLGKLGPSLKADLGIKGTTLTATYGLATFVAAIALFFVGPVVDRVGPRLVMAVSATVLGGACWMIGQARGPVTLAASFFLLRFAGQGALGLAASHSTAMWFERRLGIATGIKCFAMPLAVLVLAPLTTWLIAENGWRLAYGFLGAGVWVIMLPLILLHRNYPEDVGQSVDGASSGNVTSAPAHPHPHAHADAELVASAVPLSPQAIDLMDDPTTLSGELCFTRRQALSTAAFWIVASAMTASALVGTAIVFLLSELTEAAGLPSDSADQLLQVFAVASAGCAPFAGGLTDRAAPRWLVSLGALLLAMSCAAFASASNSSTAWTAMVLLAASQTLIFIAGGTLVARFFGRRHHGGIRAALAFAMVLGTAAGPYLTAHLAQSWGYLGALWILAATCIPVVIAGMTLAQPGDERERAVVRMAQDCDLPAARDGC